MKRLRSFFLKGAINVLIAAEAVALIVVILMAVVWNLTGTAGVVTDETTDELAIQENSVLAEHRTIEAENAAAATEEAEVISEPEQNEIPRILFTDEVEELLSSLTREEMLAQAFLLTPEQLTGNSELVVTLAGETTRRAFEEYPIGGLYYSEENFPDDSQARTMLQNTREISVERLGVSPFLLMSAEETDTEDREGLNAALIDISPAGEQLSSRELEERIGGMRAQEILPILLAPVDAEVTAIREEVGYNGLFATVVDDAQEAEEALKTGFGLLLTTGDFTELYQALLESSLSETLLRNTAGEVLSEKMKL